MFEHPGKIFRLICVVAMRRTHARLGVLSYAFLVAAILKARTLSPNREQNFATGIFSQK
jgi:RsiW-degrading membrane proteinase PrsW (M82 family)